MAARQPNTDGRIARGERTRESIVAAHTALLREGDLKPTGSRIAARAGVSVRTLWLNFKDLEALLGETTAYWLAADDELGQPIDPGLPLAERVDAFCAQRIRRLENIAPAARAARLGEPFSPALRESRRNHVTRVRSEVESVFGTELDASGARRGLLVHGVVVAAGWAAWEMLRDDFGVEVDEAAAVMRQTIGVLFGAGSPPAA